MSKIIWLLTAVLSLIISVVINFNAKSVTVFLISSLILALIIFGIIALIIKLIQNIKEKNTKKAMLFGVLSVVLIVIFYFGYLSLTLGGVCWTAVTPAHFRTNIFTGQCDFGGYSSCATSDPWYYKSGCYISSEEKIDILKKTRWYDQAIEECNMMCEAGPSEMYCIDGVSYFGRGISCKDLISCDSISCNSSLYSSGFVVKIKSIIN